MKDRFMEGAGSSLLEALLADRETKKRKIDPEVVRHRIDEAFERWQGIALNGNPFKVGDWVRAISDAILKDVGEARVIEVRDPRLLTPDFSIIGDNRYGIRPDTRILILDPESDCIAPLWVESPNLRLSSSRGFGTGVPSEPDELGDNF